ncbi:MAG: hypothetical protein JWO47_992 [Candidatus Saccharibacteria bacterium]|nr:hypothetical protein [Candidatus Saccharibacteria bacterium]
MILIKKFAATGVISFFMLLVGASSLPMHASAAVDPLCDKSSFLLGLPTWYEYLEVGKEFAPDGITVVDKCAVIGPAKEGSTDLDLAKVIPLVGLAVLEIMLRIGGLAGFFFVIYGGFRYITSQGEPDKTKQSRQTITNALIGMVISIIAAAAVSFIANTLSTK